ncbi:23S rRNA (uracil(1939)-C(5))-methyltransferase RlmD [Thermococcus thioreducens]|uniref:23S rRNA (Uracil-5-)-methyltransferase RumA n=1 Tax=Thermococcus thioreducens TaxID=277988 RepID=A0A0Q2QTB2_9EURY|nr:23S rRNA (uracil(1939)-C(5))-methyltransferase RlmD [Thermococcus thioreducens]KQH83253.1 SAM-dependent methyltransferase [Thermococcus thioreducens]SEW22872.1 23S rRNA (uracil-5-)-methyltransferase RumA [Thermococcus thioreducens]
MRGVVERLDNEGLGVVRLGKRDVHVPFTAPGDEVEVRRWRKKKRTLVATDFEVIKPSSMRIEPRCPHFGTCGGCLLQHIPYDEQVRFKSDKLSQILGFDVNVIPSPVIYGHRNRIDVVISTNGIGFRRRGTWWDAVDIEGCPVFGDSSRKVLHSLRDFIEDFKPSLYEIRRNEGFLRYIVIREGKFTGELMVNLVTSEGELPAEFPEYFDYATSVYWSVNRTKSDVSHGDVEKFWGSEFIRERLDDTTYLIHPNSFFQTNSYGAVHLVREVAKLIDGERVLDLYSGVGTFGIYLAKRGFSVEGIEINPFAVEMANKNAQLNGVEATFKVGEDKDVENLSKYDTVIVDPPRAGLHPRLVRKFLKEGPQSIVYVSCNPKTLKDNLNALSERYTVESAVGLDMFPHTPHVETVVKLKLKV